MARVREKERETQRERDRDRETETEKDRQTDRQRERNTQTDRQTETNKQRQIQKETDRDRYRERQIYTLSSSGAVPYRYKLFQYSLDRCRTACVHTCTGTVPIDITYPYYKLSGPNCTRTVQNTGSGIGTEQYGMRDTFTDVDRWSGTVPI